MDSITTWLFIVTLFLCGANTGALLHARTGIPAGRPFWPGVLLSVPLGVMAAAHLGGASRTARIAISFAVILSCVVASVLHARARLRDARVGR